MYIYHLCIVVCMKCDDPARINCVRDHIVLRRTERYDASVQLPQLRRQQQIAAHNLLTHSLLQQSIDCLLVRSVAPRISRDLQCQGKFIAASSLAIYRSTTMVSIEEQQQAAPWWRCVNKQNEPRAQCSLHRQHNTLLRLQHMWRRGFEQQRQFPSAIVRIIINSKRPSNIRQYDPLADKRRCINHMQELSCLPP